MKKQVIMLAFLALAMPLVAQETNEVTQPESEPQPTVPAPPDGRKRRQPTEAEQLKFKRRHLKLLVKALKEIGVSDEQRQQIIVLQEAHMEKMKTNWTRLNKARRELSRLQDAGATMEELEAAIQKVSEAQTEQLRILVYNRMEMERILGKEKNDLLMKKAREMFHSHGKRPGANMPPRPSLPPAPGQDQTSNTSPPPPPPTTNSIISG